jgi:hypothetical protein
MAHQWTDEEMQGLRQRIGNRESPDSVAKALGRSISSVRNAMHRGNIKVPKGAAPAPPPREHTIASPYTDTPISVEQLVEMFEIDLGLWEPYHITPNVWQMGAKHPETGEILKANLYQTKVLFRRKPARSNDELAAELIADILAAGEDRKRPAPHVLTFPRGTERFALEPDLFDIHIAKYAWREETGTDYDSDLAERIATAALTDLLAQAKPYPISECILPLGNDFFHYDNPQGETTAGTVMDRDTRYQRMFRIGCRLARWMIERCAEIAPTKVIVVPGNHDQISAFSMGVVMEAEFRNDPRVTFDNSPKPRKYHRYGKNLLGFAHGHGEKPDALAQLMPLEEAEAWAQTTCREFHLGHFHVGKKRDPITVDDKTSVTLRWIRSLAGTDAWHAGKGFMGRRHAEAFLWREAGGMRAHFVSLPVDELLARSA